MKQAMWEFLRSVLLLAAIATGSYTFGAPGSHPLTGFICGLCVTVYTMTERRA